ncbi:hypothetical protein B0J18DRAFT_299914 [Chaetomium sp. MPI-SDFR-AT-0129]|nr:hypothetical protein B0J18DRAFT_299914 [Chaetomium sp. MPI-SDFR-AT-0129]
MPGAEEQKPQYGKRLLVNIVDERARNEPDREWVSIPNSSDPKDGWKTITYKQAANAIDRVAHKLVDSTGRPAKGEFPTVAYIGPNDVRYLVFVFGAVKAGYQALFVSPRNSSEGQLNLFEKTNCSIIWFDAVFQNAVQSWAQKREMRTFMAEPIPAWFSNEPVEPFPYNKTFDEAEWEPFVVLHTSGSTGFPKPVVARHGMLAIGDKFHNLDGKNGVRYWLNEMARRSKRLLYPMPLFHAAALYLSILMIHYWDVPAAFSIGDRPLTPELVTRCLKYVDADAVALPPAILQEMSQVPEQVEALKKLSFVAFGGGNLSPESGDQLVAHGVQLVNLISATEFAPFPIYWPQDPKLWRYFHVDSETFGCEWRLATEDGAYEQVIVRKDKHPGYQGFFYTFPDAKEYSTNDIYKPHPTLPDHWLYYGRADSIIVFSNGEKLNPTSIEDIVSGHPKVKGALVVGSQRFQPALILEPTNILNGADEVEQFIEDVWPTVVTANKETVAHGQISRPFVSVSNPEKPFLRAGKGTIQRAGTVRLYQDEIDRIYTQADQVTFSQAPPLDLSSKESLTRSVIALFEQQLHAPALGPETDFFSVGVDSMQVINASRLIRAGLEAQGAEVHSSTLAPRIIYGNPTASRLAGYIISVVSKDAQNTDTTDAKEDIHTAEAILQKYTQDLPPPRAGKPEPADEGQVIVITGTTGTLGSYMLDIASRSPRVQKVICLNRSDDAEARQKKSNEERGLQTDFSKTVFLRADLSQSELGIGKENFEELLTNVDRVIHNQWPVNFNIPVESFEPHIRGVRNLADFSNKASKQVPIVFISSIATVTGWNQPGDVPEQSLREIENSTGGYGRSKLVSSLILDAANKISGVPVAVLRVGQVAGPSGEKGVWNRHEWLPSIIASSLYLGVLPDSLGLSDLVDWIPIEGMASAVLELSGVISHASVEEIHGYFHGVNPQHTQWSALADAVKQFYGGRIQKLVSLEEWVDALEKSQQSTENFDKNPGVKLLDTYKAWVAAAKAGHGQVALDTSRTTSRSKTMREMRAITPELMNNWCRQWGF